MPEFRRVFITGATSGLGRGLARHYARPGAVLGLVARRGKMLQDLATDLQAEGATVHAYTQDVGDTKGLDDVIKRYLEAADGVDLVIANAGVGLKYAVHESTAEQVVQMININVNGVVNTLMPFVPGMLEQRAGILVGLSSVAGFRAMPWRSAYCASKAAVKTYMDGVRMELRGTGVHAMAICPGFVDTPLTDDTPSRAFLLDVPTAVRKIARAIERRRKTFVFPWQWKFLNPLWTRIPEALLVKVIPSPGKSSTSEPQTRKQERRGPVE